ncbi:MAG: hypothetical protein Q8N94_08430 [Methanoregula sp.]|nr:hypothetical protein [Methanoregula sp.]
MELRIMFGWSKSSNMPATYIQLSGADEEAPIQLMIVGRAIFEAGPIFIAAKGFAHIITTLMIINKGPFEAQSKNALSFEGEMTVS